MQEIDTYGAYVIQVAAHVALTNIIVAIALQTLDQPMTVGEVKQPQLSLAQRVHQHVQDILFGPALIHALLVG